MPPTKIMLIRHAEKPRKANKGKPPEPPFGVDELGIEDKHSLIPRGWQRAGALVEFFQHPTAGGPIATPAYIYAAGADPNADVDEDETDRDTQKSLRSQQTVTPLARKLSFEPPLDTRFTVGQEDLLADDIRTRDGVVLIAWEHHNISTIVRALGGTPPGEWPNRFDLVWVLEPDASPGDTYAFVPPPVDQSLLDGDEQTLAPRASAG